jgi:hypothetical protein
MPWFHLTTVNSPATFTNLTARDEGVRGTVKRSGFGVLIVAAASGCAANVEVGYPTPAGSIQTGTVLVRFTEPMTSVSVRVEGVLVAEDEHTERVEITDVPTGSREVTVVASEGSRKAAVHHTEHVTVDAEKPAVILVATPPRSIGYWINSSVWMLVYGVLLFTTYDR